MAFSSNTRSWKACSDAQRRECKAHASFNVLKQYLGDLKYNIVKMREMLVQRIDELNEKQRRGISLSDNEKKLVSSDRVIRNLSSEPGSIADFERIFNGIESEVKIDDTSILSSKELKSLLRSGDLSSLIKAASPHFPWTGGSNRLPSGKSSSEVGISDRVLDLITNKNKCSNLLESWLQAGDRHWWSKYTKPAIKGKNEELKKEQGKPSPSPAKMRQLKIEIAQLEKNWKLSA